MGATSWQRLPLTWGEQITALEVAGADVRIQTDAREVWILSEPDGPARLLLTSTGDPRQLVGGRVYLAELTLEEEHEDDYVFSSCSVSLVTDLGSTTLRWTGRHKPRCCPFIAALDPTDHDAYDWPDGFPWDRFTRGRP